MHSVEEAFILDDKDIEPYQSYLKVFYMPAKITNHKIVLEINNLENVVKLHEHLTIGNLYSIRYIWKFRIIYCDLIEKKF